MDIVVCIKQVPDVPNIRIDKHRMTIIREGVESIINPLDCVALEIDPASKRLLQTKPVFLGENLPSIGRADRVDHIRKKYSSLKKIEHSIQ